jgi:hypothetical protein
MLGIQNIGIHTNFKLLVYTPDLLGSIRDMGDVGSCPDSHFKC